MLLTLQLIVETAEENAILSELQYVAAVFGAQLTLVTRFHTPVS
jgi:hypothetical protein